MIDTLLVLGAVFLLVKFVLGTMTAPTRSAASLKRIEEELKAQRKS